MVSISPTPQRGRGSQELFLLGSVPRKVGKRALRTAPHGAQLMQSRWWPLRGGQCPYSRPVSFPDLPFEDLYSATVATGSWHRSLPPTQLFRTQLCPRRKDPGVSAGEEGVSHPCSQLLLQSAEVLARGLKARRHSGPTSTLICWASIVEERMPQEII